VPSHRRIAPPFVSPFCFLLLQRNIHRRLAGRLGALRAAAARAMAFPSRALRNTSHSINPNGSSLSTPADVGPGAYGGDVQASAIEAYIVKHAGGTSGLLHRTYCHVALCHAGMPCM
jgi:hypothetical protein